MFKTISFGVLITLATIGTKSTFANSPAINQSPQSVMKINSAATDVSATHFQFVNQVVNNQWRYKYHNNHWWYWMPSNSWMIWYNNGWVPYNAATYATYYPSTTYYPNTSYYGYSYPSYNYSYPSYSYGYYPYSNYYGNYYGRNYGYGYSPYLYRNYGYNNYGYGRGGVSVGIGYGNGWSSGYRGYGGRGWSGGGGRRR